MTVKTVKGVKSHNSISEKQIALDIRAGVRPMPTVEDLEAFALKASERAVDPERGLNREGGAIDVNALPGGVNSPVFKKGDSVFLYADGKGKGVHFLDRHGNSRNISIGTVLNDDTMTGPSGLSVKQNHGDLDLRGRTETEYIKDVIYLTIFKDGREQIHRLNQVVDLSDEAFEAHYKNSSTVSADISKANQAIGSVETIDLAALMGETEPSQQLM